MKKVLLVFVLIISLVMLSGCLEDSATDKDIEATFKLGDKLAENQPTPTDIDYSLERYNLIKRLYWVNGMRDKSNALQSPVPLPLGYIVLFTGNTVVAQFTVLGKVSSLNSWLTPDMWQEYYSNGAVIEKEMPDVDGTYGSNDDGIFFFTVDGKYIEWNGTYLYTDLFISVDNPVVIIETEGE